LPGGKKKRDVLLARGKEKGTGHTLEKKQWEKDACKEEGCPKLKKKPNYGTHHYPCTNRAKGGGSPLYKKRNPSAVFI